MRNYGIVNHASTHKGGKLLSAYSKRLFDAYIKNLFSELPAIEIYGAKAVGKTSTAERFSSHNLALDIQEAFEIVQGGLPMLRKLPKPLLIDEWQRYHPVWDYVRRLVDEDTAPGQYLLTGSSLPKDASVHSGAGRIVRLRMRPLSIEERRLDAPIVGIGQLLNGEVEQVTGTTDVALPDYIYQILNSGFPAINQLSPRAARMQLNGYIDNIIHREFPDRGLMLRKPEILRRWLKALAAATGSTASYQAILKAAASGESATPAKNTTAGYRDTLDALWITDRVEAWLPTVNDFAVLAKAPKHYLVDPALSARLLSVSEDQLLKGAKSVLLGSQRGSLLGRLFESLVAQSFQTYCLVNEAELRHYRSAKGEREIDFIVSRGESLLAIEVKLGTSVCTEDVSAIKWLQANYHVQEVIGVVVYAGSYAYTRPDHIHVIPAALIGSN